MPPPMLKRRTTKVPPAIWGTASLPDFERLRAKIKIDKDDLDTACAEQAELFLEISEQYSMAVSHRDKAKSDVAYTDAKLAYSLRPVLAQQKIKDTKDNINDAILMHADHLAAVAKLDAAQGLVDKWGDLKYSFDQRMRMLREMVQLFSTSYFTTRTMGSTNHEHRDMSAKMIRERVNTAREEKDRGG